MNAEKVTNYIVNWLKEYANKANVNGFVVGVSGGIDSAVTSTLCALTGLEVICLEMPIHQDIDQVTRAKKHIDFLEKKFKNVRSDKVDLTPVFESFKNAIPFVENKNKVALSLANTRARLRMTTLYYYAGIYGLLVAGTGNKVEDFGVGFYTKYGDGGVDLSPIADLLKSEVYKIAKYLGIIDEIQQAAPTDGLYADSKSDEEQIGATYDELEWAMTQEQNKKSISDFTGRKKEIFKIYKTRNAQNKHKMVSIPVCKIPENLR